jgi:hypothetical protein
VSNSGRLAGVIRDAAHRHALQVDAVLSERVDELLKASTEVVATADSAILDVCGPWLSLARIVVERHQHEFPPRWLLHLG